MFVLDTARLQKVEILQSKSTAHKVNQYTLHMHVYILDVYQHIYAANKIDHQISTIMILKSVNV